MGINLYAERNAKKERNGICRGKVSVYMQTDIPAHVCNVCFRLSLPTTTTLISKQSVIPFIIAACNTDFYLEPLTGQEHAGMARKADCWPHMCHIIGLLH